MDTSITLYHWNLPFRSKKPTRTAPVVTLSTQCALVRTCREPIRTPEQDQEQKPLQVTLQAEEWGFSCALPPAGNFLRSSAPKMTRLSLGLELGSGLKEIASDFKDLTSTKWYSFFLFVFCFMPSFHVTERTGQQAIANLTLSRPRGSPLTSKIVWR